MKNATNKTEEELRELKNSIHERLVSSLSFAEVVQIMNGMFKKEVDDRIESMSEEQIEEAFNLMIF